MHPRELKQKYNLSLTQMAFYLTCDRRTVERYCSFTSENPRQIVYLACWLLDVYWQQIGKVVPPDFLMPTVPQDCQL